jgi:tape measure domain-containing protein
MANFAQAGTKLTGVLTGVNKANLIAIAGFGGLAAAAVAVEGVIVAVTAKIALFGVQTAASFETLQIQLEGLLGSAQAGKDELNFLLNLGQTSIVPTESLIAASRQLAAFGVENTKQRRALIQFISDFGTATSATEQQIYFLSLAVGQVAARGKADMVDLKQLGNAGIKTIDVYKQVGKEIGKPWQEVRDGVKDGIITSDLLIKALTNLSSKYGETAKKAMLSTNGLIANIKDIVTVGMGRAFESLNKQIGGFLLSISDALKSVDFTQIAIAVQSAIDSIKRSLGEVPAAGDATVTFFNETLPNAIKWVGDDIAALIANIRLLWIVIQTVAEGAALLVTGAADAIIAVAIATYDGLNAMTLGLGGVIDANTAGVRDKLEGMRAGVQQQMTGMLADISRMNDEANAIWNATTPTKVFTYSFAYAGMYGAGGSVYNSQLGPYVLDAMKPKEVKNDPLDFGSTPKTGGGSKVDPALARMKKLIDLWKELTAQSKKGRDALREAFVIPFAKKQPGATTEAFKQFSSGEVDTIVSQYKTIRQALEDFYALAEGRGGKGAAKARGQRKSSIDWLKDRTGKLVALASQRAKIMQDLTDREDAYNREIEKIDARRDDLAKQMATQQQKVSRQFDDYYTASSATQGTFVKGAITAAQEALDAATTAYETANAKLEELIAARDAFLASLREMAWNFVNDLSKVNEEITRFTRLDSIGSFSSVTEQVANTASFTAGLKERLQALKDFASNIRSLIASGLDKDLVQQIAQSGPEQGGAIAKALAGASASEIADINAVQSELATTITGMQTDASAAWFDAGIAAQQAFTAPLKAAMDAAANQVKVLEEQKALALGILEAWNADQNALLDIEAEEAKARYDADKKALDEALKANQENAKKIATEIDDRMKKLPDTAYWSGIGTIDGLIAGLSDDAKLKELRAAARAMAEQIRDTVNRTLGVHSPSTVMITTGEEVGRGLAIGMGLSEPLVASAAMGLATAAVGTIGGDGAAMGGGDTLVKVFIGERELTDIVSTEVVRADQVNGSYVMTGRRL